MLKIIIKFLNKNICCDPRYDQSQRDSSYEGSQNIFNREIREIISQLSPLPLLIWNTEISEPHRALIYMYINTNRLGSVQPQTFVSPSAFQEAVVSYWQKYVHEVLVNHLGGLSLPRKNVVKLNDCPNMTTAVICGRKTKLQQQPHLYDQILLF